MKRLLIFIFFLSTESYGFDYNQKLLLQKKLTGPLNNWAITTDIDYRKKEDELNYRHYDAGLKRSFKDDWSFSLKYRHVYKKSDGQWDLAEQRPQIQISKSIYTNFVKLSSRFRQEYRIIDGDDLMRSRLRLRLLSNKKILGLTPFISNEIFYDIKISRYNKNFTDLGIIFPKIARLSTSISYRYIKSYDETIQMWEDDNLILFKVKLKL